MKDERNQCENEFVWENDHKYRKDESVAKCSDQHCVSMLWDEQSGSLCWDETIIEEKPLS